MPDFSTETRTYVGEIGTVALDGCYRFRIGVTYQLRVERQPGTDTVAVHLDHLGCGPIIGPLLLIEAQWERWFQA